MKREYIIIFIAIALISIIAGVGVQAADGCSIDHPGCGIYFGINLFVLCIVIVVLYFYAKTLIGFYVEDIKRRYGINGKNKYNA